MWFLYLIGIFSIMVADARGDGCAPRDYGEGSVVCVCNATYCDSLDTDSTAPAGKYLLYSSSKEGLRFQKTSGDFSPSAVKADADFVVNRDVTLQKMFGFGGAMTDAAGINIASLSQEAQEHLLRSYFAPEGLQFNILRVPMAGCDFSTRAYSYDDVEDDVSLENFSLTEEDYSYKIPYIKRAKELNPRDILLLGAPWSSPKWMKTNDEFNGYGTLKKEYYQLWADYYVRFFEAYAKEGLDFWAVSTQNEPTNGLTQNFSFNAIGWTKEDQRDWVAGNLGPTLEQNGYSKVNILVLDDQRVYLLNWSNTVFSDAIAKEYVSGVAIHWYLDSFTSPTSLQQVHELYPDKFLLYTEACNGITQMGQVPVVLGSWERGEAYAKDIIQVTSNWVTGWIDWNLALDEEGGPNWVENFVDSAIIVNATADEFYKQPMFYVLGHFSKFVTEGSVRIQLETEEDQGIENIAFLTPENYTVVVLLNRNNEDVSVTVADPERGTLSVEVVARSIHTIVYQ